MLMLSWRMTIVFHVGYISGAWFQDNIKYLCIYQVFWVHKKCWCESSSFSLWNSPLPHWTLVSILVYLRRIRFWGRRLWCFTIQWLPPEISQTLFEENKLPRFMNSLLSQTKCSFYYIIKKRHATISKCGHDPN